VKIVVCMKIVVDPEAPVSTFKVDEATKKIMPMKGIPPVLNPYDENALEAALKIKDADKGTTITVLTMGKSLPKPIVRKSLATGADELVVLEDDTFEDLDSNTSANVLAAALKKIGAFDLVLCGREAADTDAGLVGAGIAELLGLPSVTLASKIELLNNKIKIERVMPDGSEVIECGLPALVTVSSEVGTIRTAALAGIMAAQKKPLKTWTVKDLGLNTAQFKKTTLVRLFQPVREGKCEIVAGSTPEEAAANLAAKLKEKKVI
jgi:electron transfer flavoprotein beta subunit